jgi:hypothetical protein
MNKWLDKYIIQMVNVVIAIIIIIVELLTKTFASKAIFSFLAESGD